MSCLALEESELLEDSKYRSYVAAVDKALRNFESTSEWADLISTLGKLNKVMLSHMKYPVVPRRIIISKRLAQCLHPALPSGVHLKALEIYDVIFKCMGTNRLSQELFIYSAGLFPLFSSAAMNVRSALLTIYENHFVPLGKRLRPGLNGFLAAILSGLEEGSDHIERTSLLLQKVAEGVGANDFFGCLWECILNNSNVRLPAIIHITDSFDKKLSTEDQLFILGTDLEVTICGLCKALEDEGVLVQRAALDLTLLILPMHNTQLVQADLTRILTSALIVLLRRDTSLNRRLYAWLLGSEINLSLLSSKDPVIKKLEGLDLDDDGTSSLDLDNQGEARSLDDPDTYFLAFSKSILIDAFIHLLQIASKSRLDTPPDFRPFKIIIPLLDKPEIGQHILDHIFLDLLRCYLILYQTYRVERSTSESHLKLREETPNDCGPQIKIDNQKYEKELSKNMLLVFSSLEPNYPWYSLVNILKKICKNYDLKKGQCTPKENTETNKECVSVVGNSSVSVDEVCVIFQHMMVLLPLDTQQNLQGAEIPKILFILTDIFEEYLTVFSPSELLSMIKVSKTFLDKLIPSTALSISRSRQPSQTNSYSAPLTLKNLANKGKSRTKNTSGVIQIGIEAGEEISSQSTKKRRNSRNINDFSLSSSVSSTKSETNFTKSLSDDEVPNGVAQRSHSSYSESSISRINSFETDLGPQSFEDPLANKKCNENCLTKNDIVDMPFLFKYKKVYQKLFFSFMTRILIEPQCSLDYIEQVLFEKSSHTSNVHELRKLMAKCLCSKSKNQECSIYQTVVSGKEEFNLHVYHKMQTSIKLNDCAVNYVQVFKVFCSILLELSSIPAGESANLNPKSSLPKWLIGLLACILGGRQVSPMFTQISISTLLELIVLAQSEMSVWNSDSSKSFQEDGITTLKILSSLSSFQVQKLLNDTYIFQFMTRELWDHLDADRTDCHLLSSELLLQLNNLSHPRRFHTSDFQQSMSVVERELLRYLSQCHNSTEKLEVSEMCANRSGHSVDATSRWITLWQVSRNLKKSVSQSYPYLNRCLFFMIERLCSDSIVEKSYSRSWLSESLNWGDLSRVLDPVLQFLLHPHTRRISVQHINVEKLSSENSKSHSSLDALDICFSESQIFAISSVGGEVMYHVSKGPHIMAQNEVIKASAFKKQALALTSLSKDSNNRLDTKEVYLSNYEVPTNALGRSLPISLMVNPFSQHPWIDFEDLTRLHHSLDVKAKLLESASDQKENDSIISNEPPPSKWTSKDMVESILNEIIDLAVSESKSTSKLTESSISVSSSTNSIHHSKESSMHPLHSHMLLYTQLVDVGQCIYGLNLLKNIIVSEPKLFILSLASTNINSQNYQSSLISLLARHRRSVFGEGFEGDVSETVGQFRSTMYLQLVLSVCLYFIRSYYPQHPHLRVQNEHLAANRELQVVAAEVLGNLFSELIPLVGDSRRGFSTYVKDLLNKCKVQKCVIHCLLSTATLMKESKENEDLKTLTQDILEYNFAKNSSTFSSFEQPYLFCLLDLTLVLIRLEDSLGPNKFDSATKESNVSLGSSPISLSSLKYNFNQSIPSQPMFVWAIVLVLNQKSLRHFHSHWINFFSSSLPYNGASLAVNSLRITTTICSLLEELAFCYEGPNGDLVAPCDYALYLLTGLTNIVHFCVLDSSASTLNNLPVPSNANLSPQLNQAQSTSQILFNLLHVFSSSNNVLEATVDTSNQDPLLSARKTLLSHFPRILSALLTLWIKVSGKPEAQNFILGNRQSVKQQIVEFLSPIAHNHTPHLLAAFSVVWQGVSDGNSNISSNGSLKRTSLKIKNLWQFTNDQHSLVDILATLRVLPLHSLIENVKNVFRSPPVIEETHQKTPVEVSILQMFYVYLRGTASPSQLTLCWGPFLSLVREGLVCLPPPALLVLLAALNEFVQRAPTGQDKKEVKEQQEVAVKLLEAVSAIAGSKLEATTWLRRNLTVKEEFLESEEDRRSGKISEATSYSVSALRVLAELLAPMLDVLYSSEEKERVIPLLMSITANVIPYLRSHSSGNANAFHASSQLLASLSTYQYTLKAWRKDVFELLLDSSTFRMRPDSLPFWKTLVDNLCTHDKAVFKELLNRISTSQSGSLNLFVSKEAEYEMRACLLKRVAFTIFCSEMDQYLKLIPDIQERLTEVTRLGHVVPELVSQVFLCFRVLLLRVSARGTTSLWPIVITELVQVLIMMEQELSTDTDQFSKKNNNSSHLKRLSTLDSRWVLSSQNGLNAHNHPAWLSLYFAACKLLDLMLALPASHLPQFQMYRWAFVGQENQESKLAELNSEAQEPLNTFNPNCEFVPHVVRIAKLMNQKGRTDASPNVDCFQTRPPTLPWQQGHLLLTGASIKTLMDLQPFFNALVSSGASMSTDKGRRGPANTPVHGRTSVTPGNLKTIEEVIGLDFLEPVL